MKRSEAKVMYRSTMLSQSHPQSSLSPEKAVSSSSCCCSSASGSSSSASSSSSSFSFFHPGRLALVVLFLIFCGYSFFTNSENVLSSSQSPSAQDIQINFAALGLSSQNSSKFIRPLDNKVDVVISWLNASDPVWRSNFERYGHKFVADRYVLSNEVKLNLVSLTSFSSDWLGHIYILSEQRFELDFLLPEFRKIVTFIRDSDIIPVEYLPMFNSNVVEMYMHKIKGLSDVYLYLNDDMLLLKKFDMNRIIGDSKMVIPMDRRPDICETRLFAKSHPLGHYNVYRNTVSLFKNAFGKCIPWLSAGHPPYFQSVKVNELTFKLFRKEAERLSENRFRNEVVLKEGGDFSFLLLSNFIGVQIGFMKFSDKFKYRQSFDASDMLARWTDKSKEDSDFITMQDFYRVSNVDYKNVCSVIIDKACQHLHLHDSKGGSSGSGAGIKKPTIRRLVAPTSLLPTSSAPSYDRVGTCTILATNICTSRS